MSLPTHADVVAAAERIAGVAHRTPVLTSTTLDEQVGCRVFLKCENFQRMGAFKFRGAYHAISRIPAERRADGVVAFSSGNHAQAIALAARMLGCRATIVMPDDAPAVKVEATAGYGADIVRYDRYTQDRTAVAAQVAADRGGTVIPPFDHPDVIAGQGTAALELIQEVGPLDRLLVPLGGGGLLAGSALAATHLCPDITVHGVEPEAGDDGRRSLEAGRIISIDTPRTIADGTQTTALGQLTFPILQRTVADVITVDDDELITMIRFLALRLKIIVEPSGVLGLAGLARLARTDPDAVRGTRVGVIISGGNVDPARLAGWLADDPATTSVRAPAAAS